MTLRMPGFDLFVHPHKGGVHRGIFRRERKGEYKEVFGPL